MHLTRNAKRPNQRRRISCNRKHARHLPHALQRRAAASRLGTCASPRTIPALPAAVPRLGALEYPLHDWTAIVTTCGRICYEKRKVNLSTVFAGQKVGVAQISEHIWLVSFMDYDLGYFDDETCRLEPIENPFRPKVLPMSPE